MAHAQVVENQKYFASRFFEQPPHEVDQNLCVHRSFIRLPTHLAFARREDEQAFTIAVEACDRYFSLWRIAAATHIVISQAHSPQGITAPSNPSRPAMSGYYSSSHFFTTVGDCS